MEVLTALITEKWLLSAVLALAYLNERKERLADKVTYHVQREEVIKRLDLLSKALIVIKERLGQ